jgi:hypothetical protein
MQKGRFEGDVAVKDLRELMARAPDLPPEPQMRDDGGSAFGMVGRLIILVSMAAIAAYGFVWTSKPRDLERGFTLAAYGKPAAGEEPGGARDDGGLRPAVFQPVPVQADRDAAPPVDRPELLAPVRWLDPNAGRDPADAPRGGKTDDVVVSASALASAYTASLRHLPPTAIQTAPPAAAAPPINDKETANLFERGRTFFIIGDVIAARLAFRRAAESGDAQAALALGGTFDPLVLRSLGAVGVAADPAQALGWYQKAAELGLQEAPQRLNQFAQ